MRDCGAETGGLLDIIELKEWESAGPDAEPLFAAIKAFSYHCVGRRVSGPPRSTVRPLAAAGGPPVVHGTRRVLRPIWRGRAGG